MLPEWTTTLKKLQDSIDQLIAKNNSLYQQNQSLKTDKIHWETKHNQIVAQHTTALSQIDQILNKLDQRE
jgi:FtsZ-binding cell division protein ZapB